MVNKLLIHDWREGGDGLISSYWYVLEWWLLVVIGGDVFVGIFHHAFCVNLHIIVEKMRQIPCCRCTVKKKKKLVNGPFETQWAKNWGFPGKLDVAVPLLIISERPEEEITLNLVANVKIAILGQHRRDLPPHNFRGTGPIFLSPFLFDRHWINWDWAGTRGS